MDQSTYQLVLLLRERYQLWLNLNLNEPRITLVGRYIQG